MKKKKNTRGSRQKRSKVFKTVFFICFFIVGAMLALYPFIGDLLLELKQSRAVSDYEYAVAQLTREEIDEQFLKAQEYNSNRNGGTNYYNALNFGETMCVVEIEKIGVKLPVYHGCSSTVLDFALGHIESSSLPVGGKSTHCVITGHTGLSRVRIFDNLDKLAIGDTFKIKVLNKALTYKIDQIKTVLPEETNDLQITPGKDYVTLVTCTPYGINSHRLLVRGERVGTSEDAAPTDTASVTGVSSATDVPDVVGLDEYDVSSGNRGMQNYMWIAVIVLFAAGLVVIIVKSSGRNKGNTYNQDDGNGKDQK